MCGKTDSLSFVKRPNPARIETKSRNNTILPFVFSDVCTLLFYLALVFQPSSVVTFFLLLPVALSRFLFRFITPVSSLQSNSSPGSLLLHFLLSYYSCISQKTLVADGHTSKLIISNTFRIEQLSNFSGMIIHGLFSVAAALCMGYLIFA